MSRKLLLSCMFCGLGSLAIQPVIAQTGTTTTSLVGSWEFTLTPNPSPNPSPSISGLATFTSDGTVIETDTSEVVPVQISPGGSVTRGTPGRGIWQPSPVFGSWFIRFISLMANPNATLHAKKIFTMTVALNSTADQFSGGYSFEVVDPTGRAITTGSGTVAGQLMVHPLLP
jgi:hypothetical protein